MASQALEKMLENTFMPNIAQDKMYQTIDTYANGTTALYTPPIKIYDLPNTNMSLHIHGSQNGNTLYGGSIKELGTNNVLRKLDGYECSMLDHLYGTELKIPNKMDK